MKFIDSIVRFDMRIRVYKAWTTIEVIGALYSDTWLLTSKEKDRLIKAMRVLDAAVGFTDGDTDICPEMTRDDLTECWRHGMQLLKRDKEAMENIMDIVED